MAYPESSALLCLSPYLKQRQYWKKVQEAVSVSFFFMTGEKKCLSSCFCEVRRKVQPQGQVGFECGDSEQFRTLWKSQVSSCSHMCASPCSAPFTERILLGSSLLLIFLWPGLLNLPEENVNGLHELMYKILSWSQEEAYISRVIYLWLLLKQMSRKNYLN